MEESGSSGIVLTLNTAFRIATPLVTYELRVDNFGEEFGGSGVNLVRSLRSRNGLSPRDSLFVHLQLQEHLGWM